MQTKVCYLTLDLVCIMYGRYMLSITRQVQDSLANATQVHV
jgi:hypothetical protein